MLIEKIIGFSIAAAFLLVGIGIVYILSKVLIWQEEQDSAYKELETKVAEAQIRRRNEKIEILHNIRSQRGTGFKGADGTVQVDTTDILWDSYHQLDAIDQVQTLEERDALVAASGYTISEQEQFELDHGINPYKKKK